MTLSEELAWRGFVNQTTLTDLTKLDENKLKFYMGFDASADSQTVGNMAGMMFAKCFLRHGHEGILLAGGSTSLIGDPGGKDKERPLQDEETIAYNVEQAKQQMQTVLKGQDFKLVNNLDWTKDMTVIPFLRDIGKYFSMTPLIQRDYIATRLGEGSAGISYAEFSYTVLQGMDYLHLYDTEGVTLQLGGSDQWGNCLSGVELIRRARGAEVDVVTLNLVINKATGKKFGKSEDGAVWLDPNKTSVYKFYQFWLNSDDESAEDYLKIFTELDKPTIDGVMAEFSQNRGGRKAQKTLAYEVTKLVHGQERADAVQRITEVLFGDADYTQLQVDDFIALKLELPDASVRVGDELIDSLVRTGLATSNTEARRFLQQGAIYLNGTQVGLDRTITAQDSTNGYAILRRGKNSNAVLHIS
jgi:tyrosyl-tRNA synthetase